MSEKRTPTDDDALARKRRRSVVRTALLFGAIALAIYIAFIASGVLRA